MKKCIRSPDEPASHAEGPGDEVEKTIHKTGEKLLALFTPFAFDVLCELFTKPISKKCELHAFSSESFTAKTPEFKIAFPIRRFPSCLSPLFQSEAKCEAFHIEINFIHTQILVHLRVSKTDFHMKGLAVGLALKQRRKATRKSPNIQNTVAVIRTQEWGMEWGMESAESCPLTLRNRLSRQ